ncbi:MAG TPA: T9SS type A sorting domain-containing protein, partial [Cryomorphaceae bacterium]|nr:T9SS type A sorting domain-containing protein [Cryomorphaceae bacterium]
DPDACNYDPEANFPETNVFCCYGIDDCNGLDWTVICPTLDLDEYPLSVDFKLYPNPTSQNVWLEMYATVNQPAEVMIYDLQGRLVLRDKLFITQGEQRLQLQLEALPRGTFLVRLLGESIEKSTILVKN